MTVFMFYQCIGWYGSSWKVLQQPAVAMVTSLGDHDSWKSTLWNWTCSYFCVCWNVPYAELNLLSVCFRRPSMFCLDFRASVILAVFYKRCTHTQKCGWKCIAYASSSGHLLFTSTFPLMNKELHFHENPVKSSNFHIIMTDSEWTSYCP